MKNNLHRGETETVGALLIAIAFSRLSNAGLNFPQENLSTEPEITLYGLLESAQDDAYPYDNALLNSLHGFCCALELSNKNKSGRD
ncbi:MAG: hypothetical protein AAFQ63_23575 [Cyanobacteria bacterium J06621_11]